MVGFWEDALVKSIATTKARIKFCERQGIGDTCISEKARLKIQERKLELMKE